MNAGTEILRPRQFEELRERCPVIFFPLGTIEWHERHLPVGNDGLKAHALCLLVAERTGGLVLPPLFWGVDRRWMKDGKLLRGKDWNVGHRLPCSMYQIEEETFERLLREALTDIFNQEVRLVVMVAGHNAREEEAIVRKVAEEFNRAAGRTCVWAISEYEPVADLYDFARDHAGKWETSVALGLYPQLVDMGELPDDPNEELIATSGVDPRGAATPELGKEIIENLVTRMAEEIERLLAAP